MRPFAEFRGKEQVHFLTRMDGILRIRNTRKAMGPALKATRYAGRGSRCRGASGRPGTGFSCLALRTFRTRPAQFLMRIFCGLLSGRFGIVRVRTPCFSSAFTSPASTSSGRVKLRVNVPKARSVRW